MTQQSLYPDFPLSQPVISSPHSDPDTTYNAKGCVNEVLSVMGNSGVAYTANEWAVMCMRRFSTFPHESYRKAVQHHAVKAGLVKETGTKRPCTETGKTVQTYRKAN